MSIETLYIERHNVHICKNCIPTTHGADNQGRLTLLAASPCRTECQTINNWPVLESNAPRNASKYLWPTRLEYFQVKRGESSWASDNEEFINESFMKSKHILETSWWFWCHQSSSISRMPAIKFVCLYGGCPCMGYPKASWFLRMFLRMFLHSKLDSSGDGWVVAPFLEDTFSWTLWCSAFISGSWSTFKECVKGSGLKAMWIVCQNCLRLQTSKVHLCSLPSCWSTFWISKENRRGWRGPKSRTAQRRNWPWVINRCSVSTVQDGWASWDVDAAKPAQQYH